MKTGLHNKYSYWTTLSVETIGFMKSEIYLNL